MRKFQINDIVETVDDLVRGKIVGLDGNLVTVKTSDGFQMEYEADELLKVETVFELDYNSIEDSALKEKAIEKKRKRGLGKTKKVNKQPPMEVDLHIEKLITRPGQLGVFELLDYQIDHAKKQLGFAIRKKISTVIFIHGVGEGVLKSELHSLFKRYPNLLYRDASFRRYGSGATEVLITYPKDDYSSS